MKRKSVLSLLFISYIAVWLVPFVLGICSYFLSADILKEKIYEKNVLTLSNVSAEIEIFPQVLVNAKVDNDNKKIYMKDEEVKNAIDAIEAEMAGSGRVLIRPSGTEPLVRVMIEGEDIGKIQALAQQLAALIESKFA